MERPEGTPAGSTPNVVRICVAPEDRSGPVAPCFRNADYGTAEGSPGPWDTGQAALGGREHSGPGRVSRSWRPLGKGIQEKSACLGPFQQGQHWGVWPADAPRASSSGSVSVAKSFLPWALAARGWETPDPQGLWQGSLTGSTSSRAGLARVCRAASLVVICS